MIYEIYKPVVHIRVNLDEDDGSGGGKMYSSCGTANVFEGLTKHQACLLRVRNKLWRFLFEKCCCRRPDRLWVWLHKKVNSWKIA